MPVRVLCVLGLLLTACTTAAESPPADLGSGETIEVHAEGIRWELPPEACLAGEDPDAVAAAATSAAEQVQALVADRATGWPTTTRALPGEEAGFYAAINRAGPVALALAVLAGTGDAIADDWERFESGYADLPDSPGRVTVISDRIGGWLTMARAIAAAVPAACV